MSKKTNKPFSGKKVFFSATIRGAKEHTPGFLVKLVEFMIEYGAEVLTEHVPYRDRVKRDETFYKNTGIKVGDLKNPSVTVRKTDIGWVDEADYLVAEVTSPSLGVGMEIQRALDKDKLGLNHTKILCLCRQKLLDQNKLSWMVTGVTPEEHQHFFLVGYETLAEVKKIILKFLTETFI